MGYDSTVEVYDENGRMIDILIDDISFRSIIRLIRFSNKNQLKKSEIVGYMFGDVVCDKNILNEFYYCLEKNGLINEFKCRLEVELVKKMLSDNRIKYYSITSV